MSDRSATTRRPTVKFEYGRMMVIPAIGIKMTMTKGMIGMMMTIIISGSSC